MGPAWLCRGASLREWVSLSVLKCREAAGLTSITPELLVHPLKELHLAFAVCPPGSSCCVMFCPVQNRLVCSVPFSAVPFSQVDTSKLQLAHF